MFDNEFFTKLHNNPEQLGIKIEEFNNYDPEQKKDTILGEYFALVSKISGSLAADYLYRGQWKYKEADNFDHRLHFLNPEKWFMDHWFITAANVIQKLPLDGTILDLCSGDGFFPFYFYRKRAKRIDCLEIKQQLVSHALRLHNDEKINYVCSNVLGYKPIPETYDIVVIRGAIEHFSETNQSKIFQIAKTALKADGWFLGDTPANPNKNEKIIKAHENEWADEAEMRKQLQPFFSHMETQTIESKDRINIFWCCRK